MYGAIVVRPLLGASLAGLGGYQLGRAGAGRVTAGFMGLTFLLSVVAFREVVLGGTTVMFEVLPWIDRGTFRLQWTFRFDSLTVTMLVVVTGVSSMVHRYSIEYMAGDPHKQRFMAYLSLFSFFIRLLVTGANYVQLFLGWEGVGRCSYLLINFWWTRLQANKAAIKAMLVNRVGDVGLALGRMRLYSEVGSLDFGTVLGMGHEIQNDTTSFLSLDSKAVTVASLLLFIGAVGKSAQLGLHTWLPDAMEGPTPVSALIHAATMVTAGVFLLARSSGLIDYSKVGLGVITIVGAITALFAGMTARAQNDIKRVIAYSTCSQLGYMVLACGLSAYSVGVFHLANHAAFKALLFLSAGAVIHSLSDEQDMRRMGGLAKVLPISFAAISIGSIALMGVPFRTGFYSKDVILEVAAASTTTTGQFAYLIGIAAAFCTAWYSYRLLHLVFFSGPKGQRVVLEGAHDAPTFILIPLVVRSVASIILGWLGKDRFIGLGGTMWSGTLYQIPGHLLTVNGEFRSHGIKWLPFYGTCRAVSGAAFYYLQWIPIHLVPTVSQYLMAYTFLSRKWFWDKVYGEVVAQSTLEAGYIGTYITVDRGVIEWLGPIGWSTLLDRLSNMRLMQSGVISSYLQGISLVIFAVVRLEAIL